MDFGATEKRGYIWKSNDPRDVEIKFIMSDVDIGSNGFSISGPTGKHSGSGCCSGFAYMFNIDDTSASPVPFRFRKEMWHVSYHTDPKTGTFTHSKFNFKLKGHSSSVGFAYVRYNKKDGVSPGHDSVIIEGWGNPDVDDDPLNWVLIKRTEDKGGWGSDGDKCNGDKDQVGTWGGPKFRMKSNGVGSITFKHVSMREIDPLGSFDDNSGGDTGGGSTGGGSGGDQTSTSQIKGMLTLKRDINVYRTSPCAPGGSVPFYDVEPDGDTRALGGRPAGEEVLRTGIGWYPLNNSSKLCNQSPLQEVDFYLSKVGSPTGTATITVRSGSSDVIKATMGTQDVSLLDGTQTLYQFINLSNTYVVQSGNKIQIEYEDGDPSNYVLVGVNATKTGMDSNTNSEFFDDDTQAYIQWTNKAIAGKLLA